MANGVFTFSPTFKEFLPTYRDVVRVWIGNGSTTGSSGMLYAEYEDGSVAEVGSVSLYATAVENGYQGTEAEWLQMIIGVANLVKGAEASVSYMVSTSGDTHPAADDSNWSATPAFEKGKFTWCKTDLTWIDGTKTTYYTAAYQGQDGSVLSVNGSTGNINLHGGNLPISDSNNQNIKAYIDAREQSIKEYSDENDQNLKDYVDESILPDIATLEDIDSLFSGVYLNGAIFISGRQFEEGDSVTLQIEPVTADAPMPLKTSTTVTPTEGYNWRYTFGPLNFKTSDIPTGETQKVFTYRVSEVSNTLVGVSPIDTVHTVSITITDNEDGTIRVGKSENWNAMHFSYEYTSAGRITFEGTATLTGRRMAAREFTFQIAEGANVLYSNVSTLAEAEEGVATPIAYPQIVYSLADVGVHTYTVTETSQSANGVTVSNVSYTVTVNVQDSVRDGELEIEPSANYNQLNFVNAYNATGTALIQGQTTIVGRKLVAADAYELSITGSGKLPSPAVIAPALTAGDNTIDFAFSAINYGLEDMLGTNGKHVTAKTFTYAVTESVLLPGTADDDKTHTVTIKVDDDGRGSLSTTVSYSDGAKLLFTDTYSATGSMTVRGIKTLQNRKFVSTDTMTVTISSTNSGRLPAQTTIPVTLTVGANTVNFNFDQINYVLEDLEGLETKTFSYVVTEIATIPGATNDSVLHTVDVKVTDLWDGTFSIEPTYSDGTQVEFLSVYDATGYLNITGTKAITNRRFISGDTMSVQLTSSDGNLPNTTVVSVPLTAGQSTADFAFNRIAYKAQDLDNNDSQTFHYTVTETANMPGTTAESLTDSFSVLVTDMKNGTLSVVPSYTRNEKVTFNNVYSAAGTVTFKSKVAFTNGNLANNPFTVRLTQVSGNNSTTQAAENVVLASPVSLVANTGSEQTLTFADVVTFVRNSQKDDTSASYWFMLEEITPVLDSENLYNNVRYDTAKKWINVTVTDNGLGQLIATKTPAADSVTDLDITFTNEQFCDLSIVSLWTGDTLTEQQKGQATYLLTGPNSFSEVFTYAQMTNGSIIYQHLPLGSYAVTQSNAEYDGYTNTVTYSVGGTATNIAVLSDGTAKTITVTNTVDQLEGDLTLIQSWRGDTSALPQAYKNAITYTVTGTNYEQVIHYSDFSNDVYALYQLTPGTYTVTVSNTALENYEVATSYLVNASAVNTVNLTYHGGSIEITNTYNKLEGSLTVSTMWAGDHFQLTQAQKNAIHFTVTGPKQNTTDADTYLYEFSGQDMTNGTKTITGLTLGTYTVSESIDLAENFVITPSYNNGLVASNSVVLEDGDSKTITAINTVNKLEASLTIAHAWTGDYELLTAEQRNLVTITVTGPKQLSTDADVYSYTFTLSETTGGNKTLEHLTLGTYTVTVSNNTFSGFSTTVTCTENAVQTNSAILSDGDSKTIAIISNVTQLFGTVKVTKQFDGIQAEEIPSGFEISNDYNSDVFTLANADNVSEADGFTTPYEWTIANVPAGTEIEFTETGYQVTGYNLASTSLANKTCDPVEGNTTTILAFVNAYESES